MDERTSMPAGFISSIAGLGENLIKTLQERIELVSIEVQEEKYRMVRIAIWISAAVFAGAMALTFATLTLVYLFWETARLAVLAGFTVFYSAALVWVIVLLRRTFAQPKPFRATLETLSEDRECIRNQI
jgi:uncharacterized membrane protein YqjE